MERLKPVEQGETETERQNGTVETMYSGQLSHRVLTVLLLRIENTLPLDSPWQHQVG